MFARIRKIIDLSKLSLREEKAASCTRPSDKTEKYEATVCGATTEMSQAERRKEIPMKEKIAMIHILRN